MLVAAIWKIEKLQYICFVDKLVLRKFGMVMCRSSQPRQHIKFYVFKNSTWWPIAIWKI